jgi:hypothetical protein
MLQQLVQLKRGFIKVNDMDKSRITELFLIVMDIVKAENKVHFLEVELSRGCSRYNIDQRIMAILKNEYARSLEDYSYKMKTVDEILELLQRVDDGFLG